jgi:hypothetical protein
MRDEVEALNTCDDNGLVSEGTRVYTTELNFSLEVVPIIWIHLDLRKRKLPVHNKYRKNSMQNSKKERHFVSWA